MVLKLRRSQSRKLKLRCSIGCQAMRLCGRQSRRSSSKPTLSRDTWSCLSQQTIELTFSPPPPPIMAPVSFWTAPGSYINWAARQKPAIFWSIVLGSFGPIMMVQHFLITSNHLELLHTYNSVKVVVPPVRGYFGDGPRPQIPLTYPSKSICMRSMGATRIRS